MSDQYISQLLGTLGWGSGFRLPIANAENRALENALEEKQRRNLAHRTRLEDEKSHVETLTNEMTRVTIRVSNSLKLLTTGKATSAQAKNLKTLSENLCNRIEKDCKLFDKEIHTIRDRNNKSKMLLEKRRKGVEELSQILKWDQSQLEILKQAGAEKDNDIEFMQKYLDLDRKLIEESEAQYKTLAEKITKSRRDLDLAAQQTATADQQYERLCRQFRRVHNERNQAVDFWKNVLDSLKQRDLELQHTAWDYVSARARLITLNSATARKTSILENAKRNNQDMEATFSRYERKLAELKQEVSTEMNRIKGMSDECINIRVIVSQTGLAIKQSQEQKAETQKAITAAYERVERLSAEVAKIRERLQETKFGAASAEERLSQMMEMIDVEEQRTEVLYRDLERIQKCKFQIAERSMTLRGQEKELNLQLRTADISFKRLIRACKNQDYELHQQKQKVYKLDLKMLILQNKVQDKLNPPVQIDAAEVKLASVTSLESLRTTLHNFTRSKMFLMNQKGHMEDILRRLTRDMDGPRDEQIELKEQLRNIETINNATLRISARFAEEVQKVRFDLSMEKLKLNRVKKMFQNRRRQINQLEQSRVTIGAVAKERRADIRSHMLTLQQRKKMLNESKAKFAACVQDVFVRMKVWRTKYDIVMSTMTGTTGNQDDKSQAYTEAYFILKAANEREEMKREGDIWDKRVKESEKELMGLQNTLAVMVNANQNFRDSLAPVLKGSEQHDMREKVEAEKKIAMIRIRRARKEVHAVEQQNIHKERELEQLESAIRELVTTTQDRKYELHGIHLEIANQKSKLTRAALVTRRMIKQLDHKSVGEKQLLETEIKRRCTKEKYTFAIQALERAFAQHPQLKPSVTQYLKNHQHRHMFVKLVQKIETRRNSLVYSSPLHSGTTTPQASVSASSFDFRAGSASQPIEEE